MRARNVFAALLSILLSAGWLLAAGKAIVGSWDCVSTTPGGGETKWTLTVKEQGGKLTGTAGSEHGGEIPLTDPKLEKDTFTFKVVMDSETYEVQVKISGRRLDGYWKGGGESGSVRGAKKI